MDDKEAAVSLKCELNTEMNEGHGLLFIGNGRGNFFFELVNIIDFFFTGETQQVNAERRKIMQRITRF